jgi:hypothetical protein
LIAKPLTTLLKKDQDYTWKNEQQKAFQELVNILQSSLVLTYPDFTKQFYLTTDASNYAIGSILLQKTNDIVLCPISFASQTLNKAELNYSTIEKELLAIIWSTKHFRPYLYGRSFIIETDHKPLLWLFNVKDPGSRLLRWRLRLEEYDYKVQYKKGSLNSNADALSRIKIYTTPYTKKMKDFSQFVQLKKRKILQQDSYFPIWKKLIGDVTNLAIFTHISARQGHQFGVVNKIKPQLKTIEIVQKEDKKHVIFALYETRKPILGCTPFLN